MIKYKVKARSGSIDPATGKLVIHQKTFTDATTAAFFLVDRMGCDFTSGSEAMLIEVDTQAPDWSSDREKVIASASQCEVHTSNLYPEVVAALQDACITKRWNLTASGYKLIDYGPRLP